MSTIGRSLHADLGAEEEEAARAAGPRFSTLTHFLHMTSRAVCS